MFGENKNLKDSENGMDIVIKDSRFYISYTKTDKLITALYMVTDIIDKDEPLRNKLRTLGTGIISDIYNTPSNICGKISEIMSFLDIASAINIISEMNCSILRKEFLELNQSVKESIGVIENTNKQINLSEFFKEPAHSASNMANTSEHKGHTRIGIQKGHTLMKALNKIGAPARPIGESNRFSLSNNTLATQIDFSTLKKNRREEIIKIIKNSSNGVTITDIKTQAVGVLVSCGEKTLQRELISMIKDNVLNKTGEKRWSRYFIQNQTLGTGF